MGKEVITRREFINEAKDCLKWANVHGGEAGDCEEFRLNIASAQAAALVAIADALDAMVTNGLSVETTR